MEGPRGRTKVVERLFIRVMVLNPTQLFNLLTHLVLLPDLIHVLLSLPLQITSSEPVVYVVVTRTFSVSVTHHVLASSPPSHFPLLTLFSSLLCIELSYSLMLFCRISRFIVS